jgi:hypothetical protein
MIKSSTMPDTSVNSFSRLLFGKLMRQIETVHLAQFRCRSGLGGNSLFESQSPHEFHVVQQDDGNVLGCFRAEPRRPEHQDLSNAPEGVVSKLGPLGRPLRASFQQGDDCSRFAIPKP